MRMEVWWFQCNNMRIFHILVLFVEVYLTSSQSYYRVGNFEIVSDLLPEHCFAQDQDYVEKDPTDGLPRCTSFNSDNEGNCVDYQKPIFDVEVVYKPTCAKDGHFGPKQCKGERTTGRCMCFDANGERIFGQQWWNLADEMTCACSRKKADMGDSIYFNSLHCDRVGNYENLQCDVISEQCWCADEKTGSLTSPVVPQAAMTKLPCYISSKIGISYLRQCENKKHAENKISYQLKLRGTTYHFGEYLCDDDGSFGAYVLNGGSAYCTWRDNSVIGSYQSGTNHTGVNCNCARDTKFFAEAGRVQNQKCLGNGNYEEYQKSSTNTYCVDLDGFRKSPAGVRVDDESACAKYTAYH